MRIFLLAALILSLTTAKAQMLMPGGMFGYTNGNMLANNLFRGDSLSDKKWSLTSFSAISTFYTFYKGGGASLFSVPIGLQLNRKLTNNLYAFANISVAPSYVNFNRSFNPTSFKTNAASGFYGPNSFQVYSAASMGLMYINDDKTFSISGSMSVGRGGNPFVPVNPGTVSRPLPYNAPVR